MFNLRCTANLLRRLQCEPGPAATSTTRLGDWHGNLFSVGGQQFAAFTSERSLLTVVLPAREIRPPASALADGVRWLLSDLGLAPALIDEEVGQMQACTVTATTNRSVLGSMNDFIFQAQGYLGEPPPLSLPDLHRRLANVPMKPLDYRFPSEVAIELLMGSDAGRAAAQVTASAESALRSETSMPVQYVNRKGETYFLLVGQTKTGKPKYYVSRKPTGTPVEAIPEGYEIHESPADGLVHVRKIRPTRLLPKEREQAVHAIRELTGKEQFFVEVEQDSLVVYWPDRDPNASSALIGLLVGGSRGDLDSMKDWTARHTHYTAIMQFTLVDEDRRLFIVERWCFLGSIDDWIHLAGPARLPSLLNKYAPHLGQESLYDLI